MFPHLFGLLLGNNHSPTLWCCGWGEKEMSQQQSPLLPVLSKVDKKFIKPLPFMGITIPIMVDFRSIDYSKAKAAWGNKLLLLFIHLVDPELVQILALVLLLLLLLLLSTNRFTC